MIVREQVAKTALVSQARRIGHLSSFSLSCFFVWEFHFHPSIFFCLYLFSISLLSHSLYCSSFVFSVPVFINLHGTLPVSNFVLHRAKVERTWVSKVMNTHSFGNWEWLSLSVCINAEEWWVRWFLCEKTVLDLYQVSQKHTVTLLQITTTPLCRSC